MSVISNIIIGLNVLAVFVSLIMLYMSIFVRRSPKSLYFSYMTLAIFVFSLGYLFEISAGSYDAALMAAKIQYLGIPFIVPYLFLFVCEYCAKIQFRRRYVFSVIAPAVIAALLVITWPWSDVFYKKLIYDTAGIVPRLVVTGGVPYILFFAYTYVLALVSVGIVVYCRKKGDEIFKRQTSALVLGTAIPSIGNMINVFKISNPGFDITPILLSITCMLLGYSIFRRGLYMIEPLAQEQIMENMSDGFILVDMQGMFIDANAAAKKLFPKLRAISAGAEMSIFDDITQPRSDANAEKEFTITGDTGEKNHYKTSQYYIENNGKQIGRCIMVYDVTEAKERLDEVSQMAEHDALTGLINRGTLYRKGKISFAQLELKSNAAVLMMDIDFFKNINDTYGHLNGDEVLKKVADALFTRLRTTDLVGRYGGEEFCAYLPQVNAEVVMKLAEELRKGIEKLELVLDGEKVNITISIGVAVYDSGRHKNFEAMLSDADAALYEAKRSGRNCVKRFGEV